MRYSDSGRRLHKWRLYASYNAELQRYEAESRPDIPRETDMPDMHESVRHHGEYDGMQELIRHTAGLIDSIYEISIHKSSVVERVEAVFDKAGNTGRIDVASVQDTVCVLLNDVITSGSVPSLLVRPRKVGDYTFSHSVNVCILSMYLAMHMRYDKEMEHVGVGALLHDIGQVRTPDEVLSKQGPLNDEEKDLIRHHPEQGLDLLLNSGMKDGVAITCVLDHHEKLTGEGYPRRKRACDISPYAKIISLADVYDALTTDRPFRPAMKPHDALSLMFSRMKGEFDPWLLQKFAEAIQDLEKSNSEGRELGRASRMLGSHRAHMPVPKIIGSAPGLDAAV